MSPEDAIAVAELIRDCFPPEEHPYMTLCQRGSWRYLQMTIEHQTLFPDVALYVSADDDSVVNGFADFRRRTDGSAFLAHICVSPSSRGRGIASTLLREHMRTDSVRGLHLDVLEANVGARKAYETLGFTKTASSAWVSRSVMSIDRAPAFSVDDAPATLACLDTFGFANVNLKKEDRSARVGITSPTVMRCYDADTWRNDSVLRSAGYYFGTRQAVVICPEASLQPQEARGILFRSLRMSAFADPRSGGTG